MHFHLGKIFVSHTSADKPFVRELADKLTRHGFQVWLDERDLVAGDPLAERIGKALTAAKVVLVIISKASVGSNWLRYELNLATARMVKGECRVIPVVIDDTALPSEVRGLLYADCRGSLDAGLPAVITALEHESRRASFAQGFWARADVFVKEVFGGQGSCSGGGEYHSFDYEFVTIPVENDETGEDFHVLYDRISHYFGEMHPLNEAWWKDFHYSTEDYPDSNLALIVTQRPVGFKVDSRHPSVPGVSVRRLRYDDPGITYRQVVFADLSGLADEEEQLRIVRAARETLIECAELIHRERDEVCGRAKSLAEFKK